MRRGQSGRANRHRSLAFVGAALLVLALCLPAAGLGSFSAEPTPPAKIGKGEGQLSLLVLPGYASKAWVAPFEKQSGCKVTARTTPLADEITTVMSGGGSGIDVVSAPGDAALRLVAGGDVAPINVGLVPGWRDFHAAFKSPVTTTVGGKHYGISAQFAPNLLLYNSRKIARPKSWSVLYGAKHTGKITIPDDPMFIADAALYLASTRPGLKIKDPYELTESQLAAVVQLLRTQRPRISYWPTATDEIYLFRTGRSIVGPGWPYQHAVLAATRPQVRMAVPREGVTGWLDSWMLAAKAKHPNCAYRWLAYVSTPAVQARIATYYGGTPVNKKSCKAMDKLEKASCESYRAKEPDSFYRRIRLWKAPLADCGDGRGTVCTSYADWVRAWADLKKKS